MARKEQNRVWFACAGYEIIIRRREDPLRLFNKHQQYIGAGNKAAIAFFLTPYLL